MIGLLIGFIAYFVFATGSTFGAELIYTLDVMESWYFFALCVASVIAVILCAVFLLGGTAAGASAGKTGGVLGFLAGGTIGALVVARIMIVSVALYGITTWLMENINPAITDMDGLTTKQVVGFAALVIIPFLTRAGSSNDSSETTNNTINVSPSTFENSLHRIDSNRKPKGKITFS